MDLDEFVPDALIDALPAFLATLPPGLATWLQGLSLTAMPVQLHAMVLALFASCIAPFGGLRGGCLLMKLWVGADPADGIGCAVYVLMLYIDGWLRDVGARVLCLRCLRIEHGLHGIAASPRHVMRPSSVAWSQQSDSCLF